METADVYTFCQKELQSTSFNAFEEMRRKGQFCDLTIKVQNQSITAHRIIVAAGIPYFQSAFECPDSNSAEKEIAVKDNLDPKALELLILFAYTSKVDITSENVQSLLVAAQFLELDFVRDSCIEFLSKRLNIHNVYQIRELANSLNSSRLFIDNCNLYIRKNFEEFSKTLDFLNLSHSNVKEIFLKDDLVVSSEEKTFQALIEWVKFSPLDRQIVLPELLTEVRMIYLPVPYLMKLVDTEELIMNSKSCRDLINEVKYYHLLPEMTNLGNLKTRPRDCFIPKLYAVCLYRGPDSQRLFVFASFNKKWLPLSSKEIACSVHKVFSVSSKIYVLLDESVLIYNPGDQEWEMLKSSHESIAGTAIAFHKQKIYCFGAENGHFMNKMRGFDPQLNKWDQTKEMKKKRWDPAAASMGEFIYLTGGFDGTYRMKDVEKYCPSTGLWTDVAPMLTERESHGCTSMNGNIYVCGGTDCGNSAQYSAEVYDPLVDQWKDIPSMETSKVVVSLVPHYGRMYAFGETDIEVYDPKSKTWTRRSFVPMELKGAVSVSTHANPNDAT